VKRTGKEGKGKERNKGGLMKMGGGRMRQEEVKERMRVKSEEDN
jgi:hypothetical protein